MPLIAGQGPYAREHWRHWINQEVEELPEGWKDDMIRRQLEECSRQLIMLTNATINTADRRVDEKQRALDARTLTLRREVKELLSMENDCAVRRNTRVARNSEDVVATLERRLRQLLERERKAGVSVRPQQEGCQRTS